MPVKYFFKAFLFFRDWNLKYPGLSCHTSDIIKLSLITLIASLAISCTQKRGVAKNADQQFYQDVTKRYLPTGKFFLHGDAFARVDRNPGLDLIGFIPAKGKGTKIKILLNKGKDGIGRNAEAFRVQHVVENIHFLAMGDVDSNEWMT